METNKNFDGLRVTVDADNRVQVERIGTNESASFHAALGSAELSGTNGECYDLSSRQLDWLWGLLPWVEKTENTVN